MCVCCVLKDADNASVSSEEDGRVRSQRSPEQVSVTRSLRDANVRTHIWSPAEPSQYVLQPGVHVAMLDAH